MRLDKNSIVKEAALDLDPGKQFSRPLSAKSLPLRVVHPRLDRYPVSISYPSGKRNFEWKTRAAAITSPRRFRSRARTMSRYLVLVSRSREFTKGTTREKERTDINFHPASAIARRICVDQWSSTYAYAA